MSGRLTPLKRIRALGREDQTVLLKSELADALEHGTVVRPIVQGDQAQLHAAQSARDLVEDEPYLFKPLRGTITTTPTIWYRPNAPQRLHRMDVHLDAPTGGPFIVFGFSESMSVASAAAPDPDPDHFYYINGVRAETHLINFGRKGVLLTPDRPMVVAINVGTAASTIISLMLSDAQLPRGS